MGVSVYSLVISVFFFNLALIAAFVLRRSGVLLARGTLAFLSCTVLLGAVRLVTPIDFDRAYVLRSYQWLPAVLRFLRTPAVGTLSPGVLLLGVWFVGSAAYALADIGVHLRFVRESRRLPVADRRELLELASAYGHSFSLVVSGAISRPYTAGLFRPAIYLPDIALSEEQWQVILRHEVQHIRSLDEWKKLFFLAVRTLFWWNPLAHISRRELDTLIELQCDARVTARMSEEEVDTYIETLQVLMERARDRRAAAVASPLVWDTKQLDARIAALDSLGTVRRPPVLAYLLLGLAFLSSYMVIVQPAYTPPEEDYLISPNGMQALDTTAYVNNAASTQLVLEDGEYRIYIDGEYFGILDEETLSEPSIQSFPILNAPITEGQPNEKTD